MKKNLPVYLYGACIIFEGIFLTLSDSWAFETIKLTTGILLIVGAILAFLSILSPKRKHVAFLYHEMHAIAMLAYGVALLFFCNDIETFINYTAFLFFFYAFSEIVFCIWVFNLKKKVLYKILFIRFILGLISGIWAAIILHLPEMNPKSDLERFGILFILIGINIYLYVPVMKEKKVEEAVG